MTFTRSELESYRNATIDDIVGPDVRLVFVGINPGLWTAATGAPFAHPGNRFYPAIHQAGITPYRIDARQGLTDADVEMLLGRGIAMTNLVDRATARADELTPAELREGAAALVRKLASWEPEVVAMVGITAYRRAFDEPKAVMGRQRTRPTAAEWWVLPNPSGLNAHETTASLADWYRKAARDATLDD
ncbi:MAG: mismatch-specific DNA-glycosylase [Acidimicrobiia bacterium]|nr:mismatch-specific DNA-glycosylase [Acidimicrobiia bacterium]